MPNTDVEIARRLATLEAQAKQAEIDRKESKEDRADLINKLDAVESTLVKITTELERYKGFWGGVTVVFGAIAVAIGLVLKYFGGK